MTLYDDLTARLTALELDRSETAARIADLEARRPALVADRDTAREAERVAIERSAATIAELARFDAGLAGLTQRLPLLDDEIADVRRQLSNLTPNEWDPTSPTCSVINGFGLRASDGPDDPMPSRRAVFQTRSGAPARWVSQFAGLRGWQGLAAVLQAAPDARVVCAWRLRSMDQSVNGAARRPTRGANPTAEQVIAGIEALERIPTGANDVELNRLADELGTIPIAHLARLELRGPGHEHPGDWYWWGLIVQSNRIPAATAAALSARAANASRAAWEYVIALFTDRLKPERAAAIVWRWNLAGTCGIVGPKGDAARNAARAAMPRTVPDGTRLTISTDDYYATLGDVGNVTRNLAFALELAESNPHAVAVGIDEIGGHLRQTTTPSKFAQLAAGMPGFIDAIIDFAIERARPGQRIGWGGAMLFETTLEDRGVATRLFLDEPEPVQFAGKVTGADGRPYTSSYAPMARRFIERIAALR